MLLSVCPTAWWGAAVCTRKRAATAQGGERRGVQGPLRSRDSDPGSTRPDLLGEEDIGIIQEMELKDSDSGEHSRRRADSELL